MRIVGITVTIVAVAFSGAVVAKLPPLTSEQQAAADRAKEKSAYDAQVAAYQLCQTENRVAAIYLAQQKARGKIYAPEPTPGCVAPSPERR